MDLTAQSLVLNWGYLSALSGYDAVGDLESSHLREEVFLISPLMRVPRHGSMPPGSSGQRFDGASHLDLRESLILLGMAVKS